MTILQGVVVFLLVTLCIYLTYFSNKIARENEDLIRENEDLEKNYSIASDNYADLKQKLDSERFNELEETIKLLNTELMNSNTYVRSQVRVLIREKHLTIYAIERDKNEKQIQRILQNCNYLSYTIKPVSKIDNVTFEVKLYLRRC